MGISYQKFSEIDLGHNFFDSLRADYAEFDEWFTKKSECYAYVFHNSKGEIEGFLYVKVETETITDTIPHLKAKSRLKVGTFKVEAHGTKLGERFVKKIFDLAIYQNIDEIYVTAFEKHAGLLSILKRYGFFKAGRKITHNGEESVYIKLIKDSNGTALENYPLVNAKNKNIFLLSIRPAWHTRLLPDSILTNESSEIIKDVSHTNSIHKVYLASMKGMDQLKPNDILLVYRTSDEPNRAFYRSVATSICVVEEYKDIHSFKDLSDFIGFCSPYSVFTTNELIKFWNTKSYKHIIRFTYNTALKKRVNRQMLIEECDLDPDAYYGFMKLTKNQLNKIIKKGNIDESLIIN